MQCATHPGVETELRCREHGLIPTPPIYRVTPAGYGAAVPAGLVLSAVAGALALRLPYLILTLLLGVVAGRLIGEAMSFSSGWKRGPRLAVPLLWVFGAFAAVTAYWRIR